MASSKKPAKEGKTSKSRKRPPKNAPTLLFVKDFDNPCCPEGLEPATTSFTIVSEGVSHTIEGLIHHDRSSNSYVLPKRVVYKLLSEYDISLTAPSTFKINNKLTDAFACGPTGERIPWNDAMVDLRQRIDPPTLHPDILADYPQHDVTWEFTLSYAKRDEDGTLSSLMLLVDEEDHILQQELTQAPSADAVLQLLLQGVVHPLSEDATVGERYVPSVLATHNESLLGLLHAAVEQLGVAIEVREAETPGADKIVENLYKSMGMLRPFLYDLSPELLRDYFEAARRYYEQEHWSRVRDDKFVGVQIDGGGWHYLNLMGQEGEEPGVLFFADWLAVCQLVHSRPDPFHTIFASPFDEDDVPIDQEAITLWDLDELHPEDQAHVRALDQHKKYSIDGEFPLPLRISEDTLQAPRMGLEPYTLILTAIDTVLSRRRTPVLTSIKQTVTLSDRRGDHQVQLRYPAKGDEAFSDEAPGTYRITVDLSDEVLDSADFDDSDLDYDVAATIPKDPTSDAGDQNAQVVLEASGDSSAEDLLDVLRDQLEFYGGSIITNPPYDPAHLFPAQSVSLFAGTARGPAPFVYQLAERAKHEPLAIAAWFSVFPLTFERISDSTRPKDDAVKVLEP
ncbi:MAG: hypothetical protein U5L04_07810 [Trueperaceae bacterium]|nr:hypothetical protein [Trueperaceae bacterium]